MLLLNNKQINICQSFQPLFPPNIKTKIPAVLIMGKISSFYIGKDDIYTFSAAICMHC